MRARRLITVGHSYVIGVNRRLSHELERVGGDAWEVTCIAPRKYRADLGWARFEPTNDDGSRTSAVAAYGTRSPHLFAYGLELRSILRSSWDVVYAWEEPYVVSCWQIARWAPADAAFTFLTLQNIRKRYPPPFSLFERQALERSGGWLYCGHSIHAAQKDKPGYAERPSHYGPLGVDVELFRPEPSAKRSAREELGWSNDGPPVVGFVGRFVPEKGLAVLMQALDGVSSPWRALFLGGGPLEPAIRAWAARYGDRVRIATAPHDRVPAFVNAMDLLCAPSESARHWKEQFGRMIVEAFACGVPVIGSDSGEIPFVVGEGGVIAPEQQVAAWTRAIGELVDDAPRRRELGIRALERARSVFSWPVVARQYLDFFEQLLDARAPRGRIS
ncbi:MAG TPA: glycosyltransferase family 4 protein [Polyangiaceae bacterium]|jgi:glycosyltransferase involved in cell wall biosynthesis|nr:glycosyltransferase family 4 protein [Polyangiaceae bacterium]